MSASAVIGVFVKNFLLMTPFFVLSVFVALSDGMDGPARRRLAMRTTAAMLVISMIVYFFGVPIFQYLGITLDAFQIGAGILLLLSGIELVRGTSADGMRKAESSGDIAVVPLAIPCTIGPGTIGTLLVMGASAENWTVRVTEVCGITTAVLLIGVLLYFSEKLERVLGAKGLNILSKLTGLFLSALASQMIMTGVKKLLF